MSSRTLDPSRPIAVVQPTDITALIEAARNAPLRRARVCLHAEVTDAIHEMVIALCRDSYVQPHRHPGKPESVHLLHGEVELVFFGDDGSVVERVRLSAENAALSKIYRQRSPLWHTVIICSEVAVFHEVTAGPFNPGDTLYAPWAPTAAETTEVARFLENLRTE